MFKYIENTPETRNNYGLNIKQLLMYIEIQQSVFNKG